MLEKAKHADQPFQYTYENEKFMSWVLHEKEKEKHEVTPRQPIVKSKRKLKIPEVQTTTAVPNGQG